VEEGAEFDSAPRSRRRRDAAAQGGLSVADLLARHGGAPRADAEPNAATRHRLDQWPEAGEAPNGDGWSGAGEAANGNGWSEAGWSGGDHHLVDYDLREDYLVDYRPREIDQGLTDRLFPAGLFAEPTELGDAHPDAPTAAVPPVMPGAPDADSAGASASAGAIGVAGSGAERTEGMAVDAATQAGAHRGVESTADMGVERSSARHSLADDPDDYPDDPDDYPVDTAEDPEDDAGAAGGRSDERSAEASGSSGDPQDSDDSDDSAGFAMRARRIDESLVRLTAIHAGLGHEMTQRVSRSNRPAIVDGGGEQLSPDGADGAGTGGGAGAGGGDRDGRDPGDGEPPAPRHPGWTRAGRIAGLIAAAVLLVGTATGWGTQAWLNGKLQSVDALDPNASTVVGLAAQAGDDNYLLVGTDPAASGPAQPPPAHQADDTAPVPDGPRLDTVMLVHIPAKSDRVVMTSFPANLAVDRPSCDRWDPVGAGYPGGTTPAQAGVPLATTYSVGGPRCLTKAIQQLSGLSVNHYTGMDVSALGGMVDAVHGVPVCMAGGAEAGGPTVLGGAQAMDFVRAQPAGGQPVGRQPAGAQPAGAQPAGGQPVGGAQPATGGIQPTGGAQPAAGGSGALATDAGGGPARRQQLFLAALLRKATSDQVLLHLGDVRGFVAAFGAHSRSDNAGLGQLVSLARSLQNLDPAQVFLASVPTAGPPDTQGNQAVAADPTKALFDAVRTDGPLPGENAANGPVPGNSTDDSTQALQASALAPSAVTLNVRNGSSRVGLANQAADSLRPLGFTVASVGDAPPSAGGRTLIRHSADRANQAAALADAVPSAVSETVPGVTGLLDLVLGDGFDGQIRAAPAGTGGADQSAAGLRTLSSASGPCR